MPRPIKCRSVCRLPKVREFRPASDSPVCAKTVTLTVDEYESIRLIDHEGLSQEECGAYMQIARTTVQQIYNNARRKIADVLVSGSALKIEGGNYTLCREHSSCCSCSDCLRRRRCRNAHCKTEEAT